ncbi:MAG: DUF167 domain-containing protein [Planctomycetota bacterium]|nr:MAG: DUF167 domain-containing protein [Planctomycetota bacterium]
MADPALVAALKDVVRAHPEGTVLELQAQPRARRNGLAGVHAGRLRIQVTQAPEKGKANAALLKLLARELAVRRSQLELIGGETSTQKRILVRGLTVDAVSARLVERLGGRPG